MVDVLTREQRRLNMSRIRGRDTKPEMVLRRGLARTRPTLPAAPQGLAGEARFGVLRTPGSDHGTWLFLARAPMFNVQMAGDTAGILEKENPRQSRT